MADTNTYDLFQKVEKWTTKEKFNALGNLTEIATGTEYNLSGPIEETDLASDLLAKINGKLTAPTTPTADSAVTLLADGTVGTKPLSEIGRKYRHDITKTISGVKITLRFFDSKSTALTANEIMIKHSGSNTAFVTNISNTTYTAGGGILNAVKLCRENSSFVRKIEVETESLDMVKEALDAKADIIMLDNMSLDMAKEAIEMIGDKATIEFSGNVRLENIKSIAEIGVDYISVGALTHSVKNLDLSMKNLKNIVK